MIVHEMTDVEVARMGAALGRITANREQHDQETWFSLRPPNGDTPDHPALVEVRRQIKLDDADGAIDDPDDGESEHLYSTVPLPFDRVSNANGTVEWHCGTAGCLAGHAVLGEGRGIMLHVDEDGDVEWITDIETGRHTTIPARARELLGLDRDASQAMFAGERTLPELWIMAEVLSGGRLHMPSDLIGKTFGRRYHNEIMLDEETAAALREKYRAASELIDNRGPDRSVPA